MALSNELVSQFVRVTSPLTDKKDPNVYGTIQIVDEALYVKLDGADILTPVITTSGVSAGDRVIVEVKNHTAVVTGNLTDPSASGRVVFGAITTVDKLVAENAVIKGELSASSAKIGNLIADNVEINKTLKAQSGEITNLKTDKLSANDADIKYAKIDFANIGEAAVEKLFADSGIIKDLVVSGGHITGELVGVTIKGDLIEANTLAADKLIVKGDDGLYYKLNVSGEKVEAEQTDRNSLNGSVIVAKSITASKINVDDLVAFNATVGGLNLTNGSLYSGVKNTVDATSAGLYFDSDGQMNIGDDRSYIKYFKSGDTRKLHISVDELLLGANGKNVETTLTIMDNAINGIKTEVSNATIGGGNILNGTNHGIDNWTLNTNGGSFELLPISDNNGNYALLKCWATVDYDAGGYSILFYRDTDSEDVGNSFLSRLKPNETYVLTFDLYSNANLDLSVAIRRINWSGLLSNEVSVSDYGDNTWHRLKFVLHTVDWSRTKEVQTLDSQGIYITGFNKVAGPGEPGMFYIKNLQLELGNTPTAWSPSADDVIDTNPSVSKVIQTADTIQAEVTQRFTQNLDAIGSSSGFGYILNSSQFRLYNTKGELQTDVFKVDEAGAYIEGTIEATRGHIGNLLIQPESISDDGKRYGGYIAVKSTMPDDSGTMVNYGTYIGPPNTSNFNKYVILAGYDGSLETDFPFRVAADGRMYASDAYISGVISVNKGAWTNNPLDGVYLGTEGIKSGGDNFYVEKSGRLHAIDAVVSGEINALSGKIGSLKVYQEVEYAGEFRGGYMEIKAKVDGQDYGTYIGTPNASMFGRYVIMTGPTNGGESDYKFRVSPDGSLFAAKGTIGGFTLSDTSIESVTTDQDDTKTKLGLYTTYPGDEAWRIVVGSNFKVDRWGGLYCSGGTIGGWRINDGSLSDPNGSFVYLTPDGIHYGNQDVTWNDVVRAAIAHKV